MLTLGGRIKNLREKKDIKQKDLAKLCGLTIVQLSRYETNDRKPDPEALKNIADALDTSGDYLLGRTNDPSPVRKETNMSFYGGPGNYTPDEIEEMEAALLRYRRTKEKVREEIEGKKE
ncbi:hypothetical protein GCM10010912_30230 [Paenibacillus albidus]|uniref:HTH cro/C1-type domain-containing protein n=1 Tax=Paenibacillus albidus TaxID=2041023 RepID=A0A917CBV6_9BACL|nr:helix-turn-helix domain-containing protein [Paenibacillus albidus]GGF83060.1 hypothetical protein GCM10010912_30230 [Paenibacillus albidus]